MVYLWTNEEWVIKVSKEKNNTLLLFLNSLDKKKTFSSLRDEYQHSSLINERGVACVGKHLHMLAASTKDWGKAAASSEEWWPFLMQWHIPAITKLKQAWDNYSRQFRERWRSQLGGI